MMLVYLKGAQGPCCSMNDCPHSISPSGAASKGHRMPHPMFAQVLSSVSRSSLLHTPRPPPHCRTHIYAMTSIRR